VSKSEPLVVTTLESRRAADSKRCTSVDIDAVVGVATDSVTVLVEFRLRLVLFLGLSV
jgi:hypothetical protein